MIAHQVKEPILKNNWLHLLIVEDPINVAHIDPCKPEQC